MPAIADTKPRAGSGGHDAKHIVYSEEYGLWIGQLAKPEFGSDEDTDLEVPDEYLDGVYIMDKALLKLGEETTDEAMVECKNRTQLWMTLGAAIKQVAWTVFPRPLAGPALGPSQRVSIGMSCGATVNYRAFDDIPRDSVMCQCGKHYVIHFLEPWQRRK